MNQLVKIFEDQEIKVKTDKGITLINLVCTAKVCGLVEVKKGKEYVNWKQNRGIVDKLKKVFSCECPKEIKEEIQYIMDEIENADDRNSIYMSTWLSKRLALECHSNKAMRYKNFLVSLDEKREQGQLMPDVSTAVIQAVNQIIPVLTEQLAKQVVPVMLEAKTQVNNMVNLMHDQANIYDQDREDLRSLIGLRSVNTKRLSDKLREELSEKLGINITGSSSYYRRAKGKIFKQFNATKWEEIPATKYNAVHAFIEEIIQTLV